MSSESTYVKFHYRPSMPAASLFTALFFIASSLHIYKAKKKQAWFLTPFIIGGIMEGIGYSGRILASQNPEALTPYIMQSLLLLIAPAFFAASIYMILGRIILLTDGEKYSLIRRTWLTKIFVAGDVLSFFAQAGGGGILASSKQNNQNTGRLVIVAGLAIQSVFFVVFLVVAASFQIRGRAHLGSLPATVPWKKHLMMLYTTSFLILERGLFRIVEYLQGPNGYFVRYEFFLYGVDASLMFAVMGMLLWVYPGDIAELLREKERSEGKEMQGQHHNSPSNQVMV